MKIRRIVLPLLSLALGVAGAFARKRQLALALDTETQLFDIAAPATLALIGLSVLAVGVIIFFCRVYMRRATYEEMFGTEQSPSGMPRRILCAFMFFVCAGFIGQQAFRDFQMWSYDSKRYAFPVIIIVGAVAFVIAGVSTISLAKQLHHDKKSEKWTLLTLGPCFAALITLTNRYQAYSRDPVLMNYCWILLGMSCIVLATYHCASFAFQKGNPTNTLLLSYMSVFFTITSIADKPPLFTIVPMIILSLYLMNEADIMLKNMSILMRPRHAQPPEQQSEGKGHTGFLPNLGKGRNKHFEEDNTTYE